MISIKFLFVIPMLCKAEWSWELQTWSHKIYLLDISSTFPHYFYRKWGQQMRIQILILGFKGLTPGTYIIHFFRKTQISLFSFLEQVQRLRPVSTVATAVLKSIDRNKFDFSTASSWVLVKRESGPGSIFFFTDCCFRVRVRVGTNPNPNPK